MVPLSPSAHASERGALLFLQHFQTAALCCLMPCRPCSRPDLEAAASPAEAQRRVRAAVAAKPQRWELVPHGLAAAEFALAEAELKVSCWAGSPP